MAKKNKTTLEQEMLAPYEQRRQQALEMREQGFSLSEISKKIGISPSGVSRIFKRDRDGIKHEHSRPDTPVVRLILSVMSKYNWTQAELAENLGRALRTVQDWLNGKCNPREEVVKELERLDANKP
jgi:transcriptional regulator with XRE-family HTH domain